MHVDGAGLLEGTSPMSYGERFALYRRGIFRHLPTVAPRMANSGNSDLNVILAVTFADRQAEKEGPVVSPDCHKYAMR